MLACVTANAAPVSFQSSERQTALVELYTSEGCSSCPPAESWLSRLKNAPGLWTDFVPAAFHVEYWDNLGWRDKWSSKQFSDRQRAYANAWGAENIYTPEFVLNGREWRDWYGQKAVPATSDSKVGILKAGSEDGSHWQVSFIPAANGAEDYEVTAALLNSEVGSDVKAGENKGRHLNHDFVALTLLNQRLAGTNGGYQSAFTLDTNPKAVHGRVALAVWITRAGTLEPLQAVGGWLTEPGKN